MTVQTPLDIALSYAANDWPVFPCRHEEDYDKATGEVLPEKSPLIGNGFRGATKNERIIKALWGNHKKAAVGIPTGEKIGAWVLDLDVKPTANGHDWLAEKEAAHGPLPQSARVRTANGGTHIFFRHVDGVRNRGKLGAGVDVRGEGGFVVSAGSSLSGGRKYQWIDGTGPDTIEDAPQWLLDLVLPPKYEHTPGEFNYVPGTNDGYIMRAVQLELDDLAGTYPGRRGEQLNMSAFALGQLIGAGALDRSEAEHGLYAAAVTCGLLQKDGEKTVLATIRRGLDAGQKQPRNIPERQQEDGASLEHIKGMIERALAKEKKRAEVQSAPATDETTQEPDAAPPPAKEPPTDPTDEVFRATPFKWLDPSTIPIREFAFGTHYIRKYVSVTVSPGGLGKTSNSIVEALSMTSGKPLTGTKPRDRLNVWLFNAEDPRDEMERRIMAACIHYGLTPKDIEGRLFLDTGREQELTIMHEDKKAGIKINEPIVQAVVEQIQRNKIDVMIIDPFVSTHRVNENDNGAIDKVAKLWAQIADYTDCAVDVVHHLRKLADREATVEDARGAVSLIGAARSVRVLNRMTEEQETKAGLDKDYRFSHFWISHGKSNLTKMDNSQHWRKMESVPLGNGGDGSMAFMVQDFVGVVTEWKWPSKDEIAATVDDDVQKAVLVRLANQSHKESAQSDDWAGYVLAEAMGEPIETNKAMTPGKRRIKAVLDSWIENGVLAVVREEDPKHIGRSIRYVRPAEKHNQ